MRLGVLTRADPSELDMLQRLGFRSTSWMRFADGPCGLACEDWKPQAERVAAEAKARNIRISAIGAYYANALDPRQTERAGRVLQRAIEVASHIGVKTVSAFAGGVIETTLNERGGNPVYHPPENFLPQLLAFWEPVAVRAAEHGVRLAFENCPQGPLHLPLMGYNAFSRPAIWEKFFEASRQENIGLEWDPSHLICQFIDPVETIHRFGSRIFHVHAKDAFVNRHLLERHGICHPGVTEHRMPGLGQANWPEIIHALVRAGYGSDVNIEGWHDPVFRKNSAPGSTSPDSKATAVLAGRNLEEAGLLIARETLEPLLRGLQ